MAYVSDRTDRAKAIGLVIALHIAMGAALVFGLTGERARRLGESLKSFDVTEPLPKPREEPPPPTPEQSAAAKDEAAPPALRAKPTPIVAPDLPTPSPMNAATQRSPLEGAAAYAGAASVAGPGTGAGGNGNGFGGGGAGGNGSGSGGLGREAAYVPGSARARLPRAVLMTAPAPSGRLPLQLTIDPRGRVSSCTPIETSGSAILDQELCRSITAHSRWVPALDRTGRPISVGLVFNATWSGW